MRKCLMQAKEMNSEWAVVCEDDAEFPANVNFEEFIMKHKDSKAIWLDGRNTRNNNDGFIPGACMNAVMYHKSIFDVLIKEMHPDTSTLMHLWGVKRKGTPMLNDFYIPFILQENKIKGSNCAVTINCNKFKSTVSCCDHEKEYSL